MSSKTLVIVVVIFTLVVVVGSYFLISGNNRSETKIISYSQSDKEKPKVEIKTTSSDMGTMKVSEQNYADFVIKNSGQKPLQLFNISSSCGCTVAQIIYKGRESEEFGMHSQGDFVYAVAPGNEATVRVIYRPYVMPVYGVVEREVYISTNDPENLKLVFKVKAYVK